MIAASDTTQRERRRPIEVAVNGAVDLVIPLLDTVLSSGGIVSYHAVVAGEVPSPEMHVSVGRLRQQLDFLRTRYEVLPLSEFVARRATGRSVRRCVAVTFDDAYVGVHRLVLPLLREMDLAATVFVTVNTAETGGTYWWDAVEAARLTSEPGRWTQLLSALDLPLLPRTTGSVAAIREYMLATRRGRGLPEWSSPLEIPELLHSLTFADLRDLGRDARIDFGCHTMTHPALPMLSDEACLREIRGAMARLHEELPRTVPVLAYPYGLYDARTAKLAKEGGMTAGITLQGRAVVSADDPFMLPRLGVGETRSPRSIGLRLSGTLRRAMIARTGCMHPPMPIDPFASTGHSTDTSKSARASVQHTDASY